MTFNPGMMGFDPEHMRAAREVGKHLRLEVRKCPREGRLEVRYIAINAGEAGTEGAIANCVETLAIQIAMMHDTVFGMKGKMIHED